MNPFFLKSNTKMEQIQDLKQKFRFHIPSAQIEPEKTLFNVSCKFRNGACFRLLLGSHIVRSFEEEVQVKVDRGEQFPVARRRFSHYSLLAD